jgi:uncharacterized protein YhhL (DUF1145 family)
MGYLRKVGAYAYFNLETAFYTRLNIKIYVAIIFHVLANGMKVWLSLCFSLSFYLSLSLEKEVREI